MLERTTDDLSKRPISDAAMRIQSTSYLSPVAASKFLTDIGFPMSTNYLAKLRSVGGGPRFAKFGRKPVYTREALDSWVASKLSPAFASTSEYPSPRTAVSEVSGNA